MNFKFLILLNTALFFFLTGCSSNQSGICLKSASVKGDIQINKERKIDQVSPNISFSFDKCCINSENSKRIRELENISQDLLKRFLDKKIDKTTYDTQQIAIRNLLKEIRKGCDDSIAQAPSTYSTWDKVDEYLINIKKILN